MIEAVTILGLRHKLQNVAFDAVNTIQNLPGAGPTMHRLLGGFSVDGVCLHAEQRSLPQQQIAHPRSALCELGVTGMSQTFSDCTFKSAEADTMSAASNGQLSSAAADQRESSAAALVATVHEPFAILSRDLHIVAANHPFRAIFQAGFTNEADFAFGDSHIAQWDLATLAILRDVLAQDSAIEGRQIDLDVPEVGRRRMRLNARQARGEAGGETLLLVGLEDITATRAFEELQAARQEEQEMLLKEVHHRVANSLQIIASLLLLKARAVQSTETRQHLHDIHHRLISLATVQRQLSVSRPGSDVELGPYLKALCKGLADSMVADRQTVTITTSSAGGTIKSEDAVSFGLIVTDSS